MPTNAFYAPAVPPVVPLLGSPQVVCPLQDPRPERAHRRQFGRPALPELELANALYVPSGRWPTRGFVLVKRKDFDALPDKYATNFKLNFTDVKTGTAMDFSNLSIVHAQCVSRGVANDPNAIYLVELTDGRGVLSAPWFRFPTDSQYNVVAPAYPGQYYEDSLNSGVPWDWDGMVGDLWAQMGTFLGGYPGLPSVPAGTPQNFIFPGVPTWHALNHVLGLLGMTVSMLAPPGVVLNQIVLDGSTDLYFNAVEAQFASLLEDDLEYQDVGAGRVPGQLIVLFHQRYEFYGTEETVRRDLYQWSTDPLYAIFIPAPAAFTGAPGTGYLWDDFVVRLDVDGNPLAADAAQANAIALQRGAAYYERIYSGTVGFLRRIYTGCLPFATGSVVDGVRWYQTAAEEGGWRTEVIRGPQPPWPLWGPYEGP